MTSFKILMAALLLSVTAATPVFAQAAIQEPGLYAFYHPNADILNGGAPTPAARLASEPPAVLQFYNEEASGIGACAQRHRSYNPATGTFFGRDGRRYRCE
ncbi:BA14K family protein [Bradyrhizobium cenepequi]|uniref:BA14K family protein n=1 Tax=Bradyrhizobium cenepequi TaxID=2821403 RepID=UPI001CE2717C|nr:BA14K family protein [Bradyrhizobium cenepequi]MCA6111641.1 BA14K family protein [Bradyrhizobium cenepequi]